MEIDFVKGRGNLACTIFVPFDCSHNCPFCTSKKMYKNITPNMERIIEYINLINKVDGVTEFVISGGEPTASLEGLKQIVDACNKKVFINTTLPFYEDDKYMLDVINYLNNEDKIQGINISRHLSFNFKGVVDAEFIKKTIRKQVRINCVLRDPLKDTSDIIRTFIYQWGGDNRLINFRRDYTKIDATNLKVRDDYDNMFLTLGYYLGTNSCMVCNSEFFNIDNYDVCYHRGLEHSHLGLEGKVYINDIIIYHDGRITYDWGDNIYPFMDEFIETLKNNKL